MSWAEPKARTLLPGVCGAFAVLASAACSDSPDPSPRVVSADREATSYDAGFDSVEIDEPQLPDCLQGDDPEGCAVPPSLPGCFDDPDATDCIDLPDWQCPDGWNAETVGEGEVWEHVICAASEPPSCEAGEAAFLGESTCAPVGSACPAGDFLGESEIRALAPSFAGSVVYVSPGSSGDGTEAAPFGTVAEALDAAHPGDIVALAADTFTEAVVLDKAVALVGACASSTLVDGSSHTEPGVSITAQGALLANLTVMSAHVGVHVLANADQITLAGVEVRHTDLAGVLVSSGGATQLSDVVVRDTSPSVPDAGRGLVVEAGTVSLDRLLAEGCRFVGLFASSSTVSVSARDILIRDTAEGYGQGCGIRVAGGAQVEIERAVLLRNRRAGLFATDDDTFVRAQYLQVENTLPRESDLLYGVGIDVASGAALEAKQLLVDHNTGMGVVADDPGSHLSVSGVVVRDTQPEAASGYGGNGVFAGEGAAVELRSALVSRNHQSGVGAFGADATVSVLDTVIVDTRLEPVAHPWAVGTWAGAGTQVTVRDSIVARNAWAGVYASDEGATADLQRLLLTDNGGSLVGVRAQVCFQRGAQGSLADVAVRGGEDGAADSVGQGVLIDSESSVQLARVDVARCRGTGVGVSREADLKASDLRIDQTRSTEDWGVFGNALVVQGGATANVANGTFRANGTLAVGVAGKGSELQLSQTLVRDTEDRFREAGSPLQTGEHLVFGGSGVLVGDFATLRVERSVLLANRGAAVAVGDDSAGTLTDVVVRDVTPADCASVPTGEPYSCRDSPDAIGMSLAVVAFNRGVLEMERFDLESAVCGIHIARDGLVKARHGTVHGHAIGLNVQVPDYDLSSVLGPNVRFMDNASNLESLTLPLPQIPDYGD